MTVRIDVVDPASERDLADAAAVETAFRLEVLGPDEPPCEPLAIRFDLLKAHRPEIATTGLLARDGDRPLGLATTDIRTGYGNEHLVWVEDVYVVPDARRRGTGSRLLAGAADVGRAAGRTLLMTSHADGHAAGAAFAAHVGARAGNREQQNRLVLAELDRARMEEWAAAAPAGYSLVRFDDVCPDDLLDAYVQLADVMNDAPRPESLEPWRFSAERRREAEAAHQRAGQSQWEVLARHDATGDLVGYTEVSLSPWTPWLVEQGDTAVAPAHRGHRIGRWLKATNALRILDELPDARIVETWNDGTNAPMLDINTAMGFRPVATWVDAELDL